MRLHRIDTLRAVTFISMFLYHASWDLVFLYGKPWDWFRQWPAYVWQQSICWTFIFLSGFCWHMGKSPVKRGLLIWSAGLLVSIVTVAAMPDSRIIFGILTFLGTAMIITALLHPLLQKLYADWGFPAMILLFLLTRNINRGTLGFEKIILFPLPKSLYQNYLTSFFGFMHPGFFSTDYFSLIPWIFLFLAGYYFYDMMKQADKLSVFRGRDIPVLSWIGKHSLILYLLHQPVIYGLLYICDQIGVLR